MAVDFDSVSYLQTAQYSSLNCIGNKTLCQTWCDTSYQKSSIFGSWKKLARHSHCLEPLTCLLNSCLPIKTHQKGIYRCSHFLFSECPVDKISKIYFLMFNRTAFFASLFPVTMLIWSNIFSSNICEADGNALESKGRGALLSMHCAGVALSCLQDWNKWGQNEEQIKCFWKLYYLIKAWPATSEALKCHSFAVCSTSPSNPASMHVFP